MKIPPIPGSTSPIVTQSASFSQLEMEPMSEIYNSLYSAVTYKKAAALDELNKAADECSTENWDGYNALPLTKSSYMESFEFIKMLPLWTPLASIGGTPDGEVAFEWQHGHSAMILTLSGAGKVVYAAILNGRRKFHGEEPFIDEIPTTITDFLNEFK